MTTLFVTGVGGFIGKRIAERGLERGMRVRGIDHAAAAVFAAQSAGIEAELGDITDVRRVRELIQGSDVVVHTAAIVKEDGPLELFRRVNVDGTRTVAEAARDAGAQSFVHLSSVMVYGFSFPEDVGEDGPTRGEGNPYCQTKIESERVALALNAPPGFGVIVVRPGDVYGPGSVPWVERPIQLLQKGLLFLPDGGRGVINPVYVDNLVDGIFLAVDAKAHGEVFNITDGTAVPYAEYFGKLAERARLPAPRSLPAPVMKALAWLIGALHRRGLVSDDASPEAVRYLLRRNAYSIAKARRVLGYTPRIGLDEGLGLTQPFIDGLSNDARRASAAA